MHEKKVIQLFIYRDPRDVVCSEAHYITAMNRWHRLHNTFKALPDKKSRIRFAIEGDLKDIAPVPYYDIGKRFECYKGWIKNPNTLTIRFEDLIGEQRKNVISGIITFLKPHFCSLPDTILTDCVAKIQPGKSHTFRHGGGVSAWKRNFAPEHIKLFKLYAGELLIELGYEKDLNW